MSTSELVLMAPAPPLSLRSVRQGRLAPALLVALGVHAAVLALLLVVRPARLQVHAGPPAFTMVFAPATPLEAAQAAPSPTPPPPVPPVEAEAALPPAPESPTTSEPPPTAEARPPSASTPAEPAPPLEASAPPAETAPPPPREVATAPPPVLPAAPPPPVSTPSRPPVQVRSPHPAAPPRTVRRVLSRAAPQLTEVPAARDEPPVAMAAPPRAPVETQAPAYRPAPSATISGGWRNALIDWLQAHKTYPESARMDGTEGRVILRFTASRDGRVLQVAVVQPSGSRVLDEAATALVRGARLPPFPATMTQDTTTVTLPLTYQLE